MVLTSENIMALVDEKFGRGLLTWNENSDILTLTVPPEMNLKVLQFLFENDQLGFRFLTDLTAVHYPDNAGSEIAVVYHLHNLVANVRLRMKIFLPIEKPEAFSATRIFSGANWMERETYDFFGVIFIGHPNLKRILNVDEMDYFPMRKEYPLEDQTRIDKDDAMFGRGGSFN